MDIVKNEICKLLTKRTVLILLFLLVLNPVLGLYTMNTVNDDGFLMMSIWTLSMKRLTKFRL